MWFILIGYMSFHLITPGATATCDNPIDAWNYVNFYYFPNKSDPNFNVLLNNNQFQNLLLPQATNVFILHGFGRNMTDLSLLKDSFLKGVNARINLIMVDYRTLVANNCGDTKEAFRRARSNCIIIAKHIVEIMAQFKFHGFLEFYRSHVIAHSLGTYIASIVGKEVQNFYQGEKLGRITFLDSTQKFGVSIVGLVSKDDAEFVDVIHTNDKPFGCSSFQTKGHVDFYVNGGMTQPGCNDTIAYGYSQCSHDLAHQLFGAAIFQSFVGCKCDDFMGDGIEWLPYTSILEECWTKCKEPTRMGLFVPHTARGRYYVKLPDVIHKADMKL